MLLRIPVQCKKRVRVFAWFIYATSVSSTPETMRGMGTSFRCNDFWDSLGGQTLVMIGRWYPRQPLTNHKKRLSTQTIPECVAPKACTHSLYSFWSRKYGGGEREEPSLESLAVVILEKE